MRLLCQAHDLAWIATLTASSQRPLHTTSLLSPGLFGLAGELPFDHGLVRQAAGLIKRLPAIDSQQFGADYTTVRL